MQLDVLAKVLDELVAVNPDALADPDTIVALHRCRDRLDAVTTRAAGRFEATDRWCGDGARSAAAWISLRCHLPRSTAKQQIALARRLTRLPECEAAWTAGDISIAHVRALSDRSRPATEEQLAVDEALLVGQAKTLPFHQFIKALDYWAQLADPDGEDRNAENQRLDQRLHLSQTIDGMWVLDGWFDPIAGTIVADELARLEDIMFKAEWAEAKARLGREPNAADLARRPSQRRAAAMVEMAVRSRIAASDGRRPEPLFTVVVGWETFKGRICELANGTVVAPAALIPWLDQAGLERVVFDGPSRVIDVGVAQRAYTGALRRAIEIRDQQCFHEYCDVPAYRCQVDHIIPYAAGGPTTQYNGRMACGFHNRSRPGAQPP